MSDDLETDMTNSALGYSLLGAASAAPESVSLVANRWPVSDSGIQYFQHQRYEDTRDDKNQPGIRIGSSKG